MEMHHDPHQLAVLAKFDGTFFAYFDLYCKMNTGSLSIKTPMTDDHRGSGM
jgi:hypothetical protein